MRGWRRTRCALTQATLEILTKMREWKHPVPFAAQEGKLASLTLSMESMDDTEV
jgi:hypothetical protein